MTNPIIPAATVVLLREFENQLQALLLRRNPELEFAGNTWVFPGGRVEAVDVAAADGDFGVANRIAAVRECFEECGIVVEPALLLPISHWTTPNITVKRFATQFFICRIAGQPVVKVDKSEIVEFQWLSAEAALSCHGLGKLAVMPPTLVTLSELASMTDYDGISAYYRSRQSREYNPRVKIRGKADACFLYEGDSGYQDSNPDIRGRLNRCEMRGGIIEHHCDLD